MSQPARIRLLPLLILVVVSTVTLIAFDRPLIRGDGVAVLTSTGIMPLRRSPDDPGPDEARLGSTGRITGFPSFLAGYQAKNTPPAPG